MMDLKVNRKHIFQRSGIIHFEDMFTERYTLLESWNIKLEEALVPKRGDLELFRMGGVCSLLQALQRDTFIALRSLLMILHVFPAEPSLVNESMLTWIFSAFLLHNDPDEVK